ncbi:hypothetical protein [Saccharibacillus kuerlensis]|uniref:DUF4181 domain-containing protein n=1 Tax=Saccharibacillus kuerlensis TaxID=459527 RepID=A0ABQ2L089_9BACL|nr:hypothetical protein [Saccharibacillus kuerlensis]GGN98495.1 hypothetical protein GCM10010969_17690 [Saccharibacillus kuerlensis]
MSNQLLLFLSILTLVGSLLRMLIVRGKPEFEHDRDKYRYYFMTALSALPAIPAFFLILGSSDMTVWTPALSLLALSMVLNAGVERHFVRETRQHWVTMSMAILLIGSAGVFHWMYL